MLELVAQSVVQRANAHAHTGAQDLLAGFGLRPFYNIVMKGNDRNYISISTKEVPTGLPGDTSLFMSPAWSLLRPPPFPAPPSEPPERVAERVRRGVRLPAGGVVLSAADKGVDVTRVFLRNVAAPAAAAAAAARPAAASAASGGGSQGAAAGGGEGGRGKRRAAMSAGPEGSASDQQQHSGDTSWMSHESKRQRSNY